MNRSATTTPLSGWSSTRARAPRRRPLSLLAVLGLLMHMDAHAGILEPHMDRYEACTNAVVVTGADLKARSRTGDLFFMSVEKGRGSTDERLERALGMDGSIFNVPIVPDAPPLRGETEVQFTGTVYKRVPSLFQRYLGGLREALFYEIRFDGKRALLSVGAFVEPPVEICNAARQP